MSALIVCGTSMSGKCDYFMKEDQEFYVQTQFVYVMYIPCCPLKSYLYMGHQPILQLPAVLGRSVGWTVLQYLFTCLFAVGAVGAPVFFVMGSTKWALPWACLGAAVLFLVPLICTHVCKPKANRESKRRYLVMLGHFDHQREPSETDPLLVSSV